MIVFAKVLLAHLLGDFLLQPDSWVTAKESQRGKSWQLYAHSALHGALAWAFVAETAFWPQALALAVSHGIIDYTKVRLQKKKTRRFWFLADQFLHLCVLILIAGWYDGITLKPVTPEFWIVAAAIVLLTTPASVIIKNTISIWTPKQDMGEDLQSAGRYIGIMERLFVFGFIMIGQFSAIGFLLAAKSIFRFGDLTNSKDRKLTEYVLIGTLLSFGIAIAAGLLVQYASIKYFTDGNPL